MNQQTLSSCTYVHNNSAEEEKLVCKPLKSHTEEEIVNLVDFNITEKELN